MKIKLKVVDNDRVNDLIESNNQHEDRIDILSEKMNKLSAEFQKIKDEIHRKKSQEY